MFSALVTESEKGKTVMSKTNVNSEYLISEVFCRFPKHLCITSHIFYIYCHTGVKMMVKTFLQRLIVSL